MICGVWSGVMVACGHTFLYLTPNTALTPRELEVLELVARGMSNRKIAEQLVLTEATVKSHLVHIFTKLDVSSRTAAAARAQELGMLGE